MNDKLSEMNDKLSEMSGQLTEMSGQLTERREQLIETTEMSALVYVVVVPVFSFSVVFTFLALYML